MEANDGVKDKNIKSSAMDARRGCQGISDLQGTFCRPPETFYKVVMCTPHRFSSWRNSILKKWGSAGHAGIEVMLFSEITLMFQCKLVTKIVSTYSELQAMQ